jgi:hypothetical protein
MALRFPAMRPVRPLAVLSLLAILLTACGSTAPGATPIQATNPAASPAPGALCGTAPDPASMDGWQGPATPPSVFPLLVSEQVTCGQSRLVVGLLDKSNNPVAAPDRTLSVAFYDLGKDLKTPVVTVPATFAWSIENERGIYILNVDLPEAGTYGLAFTTQKAGGTAETIRATMSVLDSSGVVKVGDKAPASKTPTLADVGGDVTKISTDPTPDPAFYSTSVDAALAAHKPFILVFATPKFCVSQQCGPTLDKLKPIAAANPAVTFINVEPYQLKLVDGQLQPILDATNNLQTTPVTDQWGLFSEPWIFAVDKDGIVRGSYELIATDAEMTQAIQAITTGG